MPGDFPSVGIVVDKVAVNDTGRDDPPSVVFGVAVGRVRRFIQNYE